MNHFLYRLIPPRPTFPADITEPEEAVMEEHFRYWSGLIAERKAIAYGPVSDPNGTYGIAVIEVNGETEALRILTDDPAIRSNLGFASELHPMPDAMVRP